MLESASATCDIQCNIPNNRDSNSTRGIFFESVPLNEESKDSGRRGPGHEGAGLLAKLPSRSSDVPVGVN